MPGAYDVLLFSIAPGVVRGNVPAMTRAREGVVNSFPHRSIVAAARPSLRRSVFAERAPFCWRRQRIKGQLNRGVQNEVRATNLAGHSVTLVDPDCFPGRGGVSVLWFATHPLHTADESAAGSADVHGKRSEHSVPGMGARRISAAVRFRRTALAHPESGSSVLSGTARSAVDPGQYLGQHAVPDAGIYLGDLGPAGNRRHCGSDRCL